MMMTMMIIIIIIIGYKKNKIKKRIQMIYVNTCRGYMEGHIPADYYTWKSNCRLVDNFESAMMRVETKWLIKQCPAR